MEGVGDKKANNEIIKTLFVLRPYEGFNKLPLAYCVSSFLIQKSGKMKGIPFDSIIGKDMDTNHVDVQTMNDNNVLRKTKCL